jgi:hypothetical protein
MTNPTPPRLIAAAMLVPILWLIIAVLTLVVFPVIYGFAKLMFYSLAG